jgi:hypothetical protein
MISKGKTMKRKLRLFILGYIFTSDFYAKEEAQLKEQEEDRTTVLMPVHTFNCLNRQEK